MIRLLRIVRSPSASAMTVNGPSGGRDSSRTCRVSAIAIGLLASGVALADAHLDPQLVSLMQAASPAEELQIVVSYEQSGPVTAAQTAALQQLGITKGITMRTLPIAGALASGGRRRFGAAPNALSWQAVAKNRLRHPCSPAARLRYAANGGRKQKEEDKA